MKHKILVLDIDGTLTNSKKEITPATRKAIYALQENGGIAAIATGRPTSGTNWLIDELRLREYNGLIISYNGARIVRPATGEILYNHPFPKQFLPQIVTYAGEHEVGLITYDCQDNVITASRVDQYMELESRINNLKIIQVPDLVEAVTFPINKCLISGEPDLLAPLTEELAKRYYGVLNIYRSEPFFLEIMPPAIDKAHALERLLPSLGISREECICCGDGYNDITMLRFAGVGVAMGNAQKEVKESADVITLTNDEDGLVPIIEKYFLDDTKTI